MLKVNGTLTINLAAGETVKIRTRRKQSGSWVYTEQVVIDSDGKIETVGERQEQQEYV